MKSKNVAFVPVRGGSKGIIDKNIKIINGFPLVYYVLKSLEDSELVDDVYVATDSNKIAKVVENFNFNKISVYKRDDVNATDSSSTESVMLEFLEKNYCNEDDNFILVQATSPFTTSEDFDNGIKLIQKEDDSVLSCVKVKRFFWNFDGNPINYDFKNRPRRQDFKGCFMENGAFYINKVRNILKYKNRISGNIKIYEMPEYTSFEIDEEYDLIIVEDLLKRYWNVLDK
jgi:N-acylneuraminate cytidylyltransferase